MDDADSAMKPSLESIWDIISRKASGRMMNTQNSSKGIKKQIKNAIYTLILIDLQS